MPGPLSTTPIVFPGGAIYPPGSTQLVQVTPTQRSIYQQMISNGQASLFQNPVLGSINALGGNVTALTSAINNSTCLNYTTEQKNSAIASLTGTGGLQEQLNAFLLHTNTLSGVVAGSAGNPTPGLERILSVGRALNDFINTVDNLIGCINLLNNMSGLFAQEEVNNFANELANMIAQVNGCLADLTEIIARIAAISSILQSIINADNNFFNDALERLRQAALASLLEYMYNDPCSRFILSTQIGSSTLTSILNR